MGALRSESSMSLKRVGRVERLLYDRQQGEGEGRRRGNR